MAIDERSRHRLFVKLESVLGAEDATVLMEQLPPVGWADVATKHDLAALEERIDLRFEALRHELHGEIGNLRGELHGEMGSLRGEVFRAMAEQTRTVIVAMLSGMVGVGGLAFAAAHLT